MAKFVPTQEQRDLVALCIAGGIQQEEICHVVGISGKTFRRSFNKEIKHGKPRVDANVIGALMKCIKAGNPASIMFYLKTRMGWREKVPEGASAEAEAAVRRVAALGLSNLTDGEFEQFERLMRKIGVMDVSTGPAANETPVTKPEQVAA